MSNNKYDTVKNTSIEDKCYKINKKAYKYALDMVIKETKQAVEGLFHNLNSLQSRAGAQLPFSSINYGTCTLKEGQYIIDALLDGQIIGTGSDHRTSIFPCAIFQYDENINGKPGTPNYYLFRKALVSCSKRIYPNFANCHWELQTKGQKFDREEKKAALESLQRIDKVNNTNNYNILLKWLEKHKEEANKLSLYVVDNNILVCDWNDQKPFEIMSTMGCRTYNAYDINSNRDFWVKQFMYIAKNGELPRWKMWSANQKDGRGNICPVTIIMPTIAMETILYINEEENKIGEKMHQENINNEFLRRLDKKIEEAREMLIERYNIILSQPESAANLMWNNNTMYGYDGENVESAIKHGTLAIGQIGLAETLRLLTGHDHTNKESMKLAHRIEKLFFDKCTEFKNHDKLNFGVYYTPAENLCKTSLQKFRNRFGIIEGVSDQEFFTNSIHVPVYDDINAFDKIKLESELTGYSTAGCITYVELDSEIENNIDALEKIVTYGMKCGVPYLAINRTLTYCKKCKNKGAFKKCPNCGAEGKDLEQLARVTGYLSTDVSMMNDGKQDEVSKRKKHTGNYIFNI